MSKNIPDGANCIRILKEAGCEERTIIHCCTVCAVAEEMAGKIDSDRDLVVAGSLLHDIGRSVDHGPRHAVVGGGIIEELGLPEELVSIVRKHIGAGLDDAEVMEMKLPPGDYIPRTIEEKIVAHADNLVRDNEVIGHRYSVYRLRDKGAFRGADRMETLHWELSRLYGRDLDVIRDIIGKNPKPKWIPN